MFDRLSRRRFLALSAAAPALAFVAACSDDAPSTSATDVDVDLFTLDREPVNLRDYAGAPMVVNFFAESCPPCVAEMPAFDSVARAAAPDVAFLGISADATSDAARRILEQTGISYPALWDAEGTALQHFEAFGLPTTALITADGTAVDIHTGELSAEQLRDLIAEHLDVEVDLGDA